MTGIELRELFRSDEFQRDLSEMSCYLASIMQERPIVFLVAKYLRRRGCKFDLEDKRHDLSVDGKRIEFKFHFSFCETRLEKQLKQLAEYGQDLKGMWKYVLAGKISRTRTA